ncbi:amino acid ABC transporter ATP-binding protein [Sinorhizobium americanum]|uniref:Polar amino acid transport system ATP-binding protein/arginine/ornithine transport system ATP-binding protein n=1 Tax=Sinorhizobium americanum TaxID=194963 RepID=A0A4R2B4X3_9HYPH|nr:amino acid ABC transporter ATP-binding protein [Sinorhizobium americanum]TCN20379.1 polar amino acid transport system ATP-binding protein/arginine/ornithine transport system ATP-binding protein [Sinorhizobium americanum]
MKSSEPTSIILEARGITKSFGSHEALKGINVAAHRGDVVALIGPSGSGKSTFLRCLNFLERPTGGQVVLDGEIFAAADFTGRPRKTDAARLINLRRRVGMVFQSFNLWPHRTALGNVMEGLTQVLGMSAGEAAERARGLLNKVGLAAHAGHYPSQLSGGQQQRVAIARTLATEPEVLLFDEPTSALDPELVGEVLNVIRGLADEGRTMLVVTHEIAFARDVATKVVFMTDGAVQERGTPDEVLRDCQSPSLRAFLTRFRQER